MARNISFALTTPQFLDGSKDVTRRMGWLHIKSGDTLCAVKKGMGLKPGEKIERLGMIRIVSVRREPLDRMLDWREVADDDPEMGYGERECQREGFPSMAPADFIEFFCASHKGCTPDSEVTRIAFERILTTPEAT